MARKRVAKAPKKPARRPRARAATSAGDFAALAEIGRLLSQTLDRSTVADRIVQNMRDLLRIPHAALFQVREDGEVHAIASATDRPVWAPGSTVPREHGVVGLTLRERAPVVIRDVLADTRVTFSAEARARLARDPDRAVLSVPLIVRARVIGVLSVRDRIGRAFPASTVRLAQAFADQAAVALENAELFARQTELLVETRRQQQEAVALEETARDIASTDEPEIAFKSIVEHARQLCGSDVAFLAATEPPGETARVVTIAGARTREVAGLVFDVARGPAREVLDAGRPVVVADYLKSGDLEAGHRAAAAAEGFTTVALVPVRDETGVSGLLGLANRSERPFAPRQIAVLHRLADQAGLAVRKGRLYSALAARARRLRALADLNQVVSSSLEVDRVLAAIARAAASLVDTRIVTFWMANEATQTLELRALSDAAFDVEFTVRRLAFGESGAGRVAATRRPVIVDDVAVDPGFADKEWWERHHLRSFLGVPVVLGRNLLAVLALGRDEPFRLDTDDQELLETLAAHAAAAIRNARIHEDSVRRGHRLEILTGVTRALSEFLDPEQILSAVTEAAIALFPSSLCRVWIVDGARIQLRAESGAAPSALPARREMPLGEGMAGVVCATGTPVTAEDVIKDARPANRGWLKDQRVESAAVLPLMVGDRTIGAFSLFTREPHIFTLDEISVLQAFAEHAAVALEKARLFHDVEERRRQTEGLYEMSRAMQKRLDVEYRAQTFITFAHDVLGFDRINALLASDDGRELVFVAGTDHDGRHIPLTAEAGAFEAAFRSRETLVVDDDAALAAVPPLGMEVRDHPIVRTKRFVIVPLLFQGRVLGLVVADNKPSRRPFTRRGIAQLELFSQQLASSITNARLFAETREQQTRLEQIFSSTSDGILVLDLEGRIIALNRQGGSLLGLVPDAVVTRPFSELTDALNEAVDWGAPGAAEFRALAARSGGGAGGGDEAGDLDVALPRRRTLRWQRRPTNDAEGATVGSTITLRDVTHEREVDRMKTEFVSMVSHELRTPLTSIKGSLHLLLSDPAFASEETNRQLVEISLSNTDRLILLINDILDISKIEAGRIDLHPAPHTVSEWIGTAVAGIAGFAGLRQTHVETNLAPDLPIVSVDPDRMVQVVTNLLSNAIKFSPEGSRVVVDARLHDAEIRVSVKDEGRGIAAADIPKLFQKFRQLDSRSVREVGGTGLGLAICRGIVEEHGGRIWVESEVGAGATFIVALPVTAGERLPAPPGASLSTTPVIGSALILVVDDESDVRRTLRRYLEREGYAVIEAARGLDAVEMAARHRPDLITMDVLLPDIDGFEAIRLLRERPEVRDVPVVVVSAASGAGGQLEPAVAGYLRKPVEAGALIEAIKGALGDRRREGLTTVLVVDDDADIRTVLGRILREAGYAVVAAADGDEALAAVGASRPDLVLLDIKMPRMSGFEVLRRLRADAAMHDLPVIVLTASEGQGGRDRALGLGATEYLRKPFSTDALLAEIRERLLEPRGSTR